MSSYKLNQLHQEDHSHHLQETLIRYQTNNMALTRQQLEENIEALEAQGAPQTDVQEYINSVSVSSTPEPKEETRSKSILRPKELVSEVGGSVSGQFQSAAQDIQAQQRRFEAGEIGLGRNLFTQFTQGTQAGIGSAISIGTGAISALTPDFIEDPIRRGAAKIPGALEEFGSAITPDFAEEAIGEGLIEGAKVIKGEFDELAPENQQLVKDLADAGLTAIDLTAFRSVPKVASRAATKVDDVTKRALKPKESTFINDRIIDTRTAAFTKSFLDDSAVVTKRLEELAAKASVGDTKFTKTTLLRELAEEGYAPTVEGKLGNFTNVFKDIQKRQAALSQISEPELARVKVTTPVLELESLAESALRNSSLVGSELDKSLRELARFRKSFITKYGDDLTAKNVDQIRKEMNAKTKAFDKDVFKQDTADAVADATRVIIERVAPSTKEVRQEIGRLFRLKETAKALHLQSISVPKLVTQLGGIMGVILAAGLGLSVAGPGGLIVAGAVAHYGGEIVAQLLRSSRFKFKKELIDIIKSDEKLLNKVLDDVDGKEKAFLQKALDVTEEIKNTPNKKGGFVRIGGSNTKKAKDLVSHEGAPDKARVKFWKEKIQKGDKIKPLLIIKEGSKYGIEDGKHRFQAYKELGIEDIPVKVK